MLFPVFRVLNSYNEAYAILTQNGIQIAGEPQYKKDLN
jgi:hypothetical protein